MLDHALKHTDALKRLFLDVSDDLRFQYMTNSSYRDAYEPAKDTWSKREQVSVHSGQVIGYLGYSKCILLVF